jgi:hypothetical protein
MIRLSPYQLPLRTGTDHSNVVCYSWKDHLLVITEASPEALTSPSGADDCLDSHDVQAWVGRESCDTTAENLMEFILPFQ